MTGDVHLATDLEYFNSATIWCKDGTKSFPRERLNDNFCDCADGTDEPGELPLLDKQKSLCQGFGIWYLVFGTYEYWSALCSVSFCSSA